MENPIRHGDLVSVEWLHTIYHGIVVQPRNTDCTVFLGNGLAVDFEFHELTRVPMHLDSDTTANFAEILRWLALPRSFAQANPRSIRWLGGQDLFCLGCRQQITMPSGCGFDTLINFLEAVGKEHADCLSPPVEESGIETVDYRPGARGDTPGDPPAR
jgi:hypothetical protein